MVGGDGTLLGRRGSYEADDRMLLTGCVVRGDEIMFRASALKDVVLNRAGRDGMIEVRLDVDGTSMYTQRADGLIVSTATGSAAYALSADGPILHPSLNAMLLVPVAAQMLSHRPIVLPDDAVLELTLTAMGRVDHGARVHFDMQTLVRPAARRPHRSAPRAPHHPVPASAGLQLLFHPAAQALLKPPAEANQRRSRVTPCCAPCTSVTSSSSKRRRSPSARASRCFPAKPTRASPY